MPQGSSGTMRDSITATAPLRVRKSSIARVRCGSRLPWCPAASRRATNIWVTDDAVTPASASGVPTAVPNSSPAAPARIGQVITKFTTTNSGTNAT